MPTFAYVMRFLALLVLLFGGLRAPAQVLTVGPDSTVVNTAPIAAAAAVSVDTAGLSRPAKAALWGLIPGGGQVYNRDYWKLPVVYAALGGITYSIVFSHARYVETARALRLRTDGDSLTIDTNPRTAGARDVSVQRAREFYRRNRDLSIIAAAALYGLSIAEALVDAHLATFSVSDDLSLRVAPALVPQLGAFPAPGLGFTLGLR